MKNVSMKLKKKKKKLHALILPHLWFKRASEITRPSYKVNQTENNQRLRRALDPCVPFLIMIARV